MSTLLLGSFDLGKKPAEPKKFLQPYHTDGLLVNVHSFRDDDNTKWRSFAETPGNQVVALQRFLKSAGFMPRATLDGIFGYVTQAATRLFQEYVRTVDGISDMVPDGIVGNKTWKHIDRWMANGSVSDWGRDWDSNGPKNSSREFSQWITLLNTAKLHYQQNPNPIIAQVAGFMGVRRAHDRAPEHAGRGDIGAIAGAAGDLVQPVGPVGPGADQPEFAKLVLRHYAALLISAAASITARTILS